MTLNHETVMTYVKECLLHMRNYLGGCVPTGKLAERVNKTQQLIDETFVKVEGSNTNTVIYSLQKAFTSIVTISIVPIPIDISIGLSLLDKHVSVSGECTAMCTDMMSKVHIEGYYNEWNDLILKVMNDVRSKTNSIFLMYTSFGVVMSLYTSIDVVLVYDILTN